MSDIPKEIEGLQAMLDAATESLLNASDDEIFKDIRQSGSNPTELAEESRNIFESALQANGFKRLDKAREELKQFRETGVDQNTRKLIPTDASSRRSLFDRLLARNDLPAELTMAFREGEGSFSDDEILTVLEDFADLGFLDENTT